MTVDTEYTCSHDGYFSVAVPTNAPLQYVRGEVNGFWMMQLATPTTENLHTSVFTSMFVRKGMTIKYTGTSGSTGTYTPIIS